jgi:hypothetical protein
MRIRAVSANDVWAVGYHNAVFGFSQHFQTSIFHWNGATWSVVPSPDQNQLNNYLWSVAGTGADDAWAVGFWDTGNELKSITQHWDGVAWTIQDSPNASTYIDELLDVATVTSTNVWAVGGTAGFSDFDTLALHRVESCTSSAMHVASINPQFVAATHRVSASITIQDASGAPVSGATVRVRLTRPDGTQKNLTGTTDASGNATSRRARRWPAPTPSS